MCLNLFVFLRSTTCEPGDEPSANHQECIEIVCPPGSRKDTASLECVPCTIDEYQDKAGQTLCEKCSAGVNCSLRDRVPQVMKAAAGTAAAPSTSRPSSYDLSLSLISPTSLAFCFSGLPVWDLQRPSWHSSHSAVSAMSYQSRVQGSQEPTVPRVPARISERHENSRVCDMRDK